MMPINAITFPIIVMALFVLILTVCLSAREHNRKKLIAQGKPVPEEQKIVNVIDWTRR